MSDTTQTNTIPETENTDNSSRRGMSRRRFLRILGIGTGTLAVGAVVGYPTIKRELNIAVSKAFIENGAPTGSMPDDPFVWIEIDADNVAHLHLPKAEMGQGIHTTLAQIAAEDLELDWDKIQTYTADSTKSFDSFVAFTFGSTSTVSMFQPMRELAATMKTLLVNEAARQMDVAADALTAEKSVVFVTDDPDNSMTYGEIVAGRSTAWDLEEVTETPLLKPAADFNFIGKPMQRVDFRDKVTGRAIYGFDARMDGMKYGAIARPPRIGATLASANAGDAASQPGVHTVVIEDGFAGIVADTRSQAYAALEFLDLTWDGGTTWSQFDIDDFMQITDGEGNLVQREGNFYSLADAATVIEAEYSFPMASHAHLEPQAALVEVYDDGVTVYCSTQGTFFTRDAVAEAIGADAATVKVIPTYLGGGFGRKVGMTASVEAARLSKAAGVPVHIAWMRPEEMRYGYHRPPSRNRLRGIVDDSGTITGLQHQIASGDIFFGLGTFPDFVTDIAMTVLGADPLALSFLFYDVENLQSIYHRRQLPIPTGSWRGLGTMPNTFAVESFIDELAHEAGIDPLEMRLNHLPDDDTGKRMTDVLNAVADASGWSNTPEDGHGFGLALGQLGETKVAMVADVSTIDNRIKVHKVWCAADPGYVVNPDGARAQVEGTITMALSSVLIEKLTVEDGMIVADNFSRYPLLTMRDTPDIEVIFVESNDTPLGGLGEAVIGIVPAAVANAVFAASGQRLRDLPLKLT